MFSFDLIRHLYFLPGQMWKLSAGLAQVHSNSEISGTTLSDRSVKRLTLAASTDWVVDPSVGAERGTFRGAVSSAKGEANAYALNMLEERGELFVGPQMKVYQGMIIGENAKPDDLEVNPMKAKQLSNVRSSGKDDAIRLTPPRRMTLEQSIAYIDDDEMVEVTPLSIRLRKAELDPNERKKMRRKKES